MAGQVCTICGEQKAAGQIWFLLAENSWEDKLQVLHWQDRLANRDGVYRACSPAHVRELVTHWMTMGTLDYPFADSSGKVGRPRRSLAPVAVFAEPDIQEVRQIGELAVHRESVGRILEDNPDSLQIILDELSDALERETVGAIARFESAGARPFTGLLRQM
jgi:hypothetical protein